MEDKLFIMNSKNKSLPSYILEDGTFKVFGDYKDPVRNDERVNIVDNSIQIILPIESILDDKFKINSDGVIEYRERVCSCCMSKKVHKKGYAWTNICLEKGIVLRVKVKRYHCRHCFKWTQTEFVGYFDKYTGLPSNLKKLIRNIRGNTWMSLRTMKKTIKDLTGISLSHETIRKNLLVDGDYYYLNENVKLSGYYEYDEQLEKVNGKWVYYYVLFDLINRVPIATFLTDSVTNAKIKDFINKSIPSKDRIAIVTDLNPGYNTIMRELGFVHQLCVFHLSKNIWNKINDHVNEELRKYKSKLKKSSENLSDSEIKKLVKAHKKELNDEMKDYMNTFMKLFEQENYNKALEYIEFLKLEFKKFPKFLANYLTKNFLPKCRKFLHFLENDHIGKLDAYNNKIENYNRITMPRYEKKTYRTWRGLWSALMHKKDVWIENRKKEHTT